MKRTTLINGQSARNGMAIVTVMAFSTILLILGITYLKTFSQSTITGKLQLEQVQSEFFAKGIQNIALFKIKRYPDFFLRSYRSRIYYKRLAAGEALEPALVDPEPNPSPFARFTGVFPGKTQDLLSDLSDAEDAALRFSEPVAIATYSTAFSLMSSDDFKRAFIEITVHTRLTGSDVVNTYRKSLDASQTARL
jgi:hypothetical protein